MEYKVLLVDQRKMIKRLLLAILIYLILYSGFVFSIFTFQISNALFLTLVIILVLLIPLLPYLLMRPAYYREMITLNECSISTAQFGEIDLDTIVNIKYAGRTALQVIKLKLENGFRLMIMAPYRTTFFTKDHTFDLYRSILRNSKKMKS